jgi:hypothetical protein
MEINVDLTPIKSSPETKKPASAGFFIGAN